MPGAARSLCTADGVNGRLDSEMLVRSQTPEDTPQQGRLKDGPGQASWAEMSHSRWTPATSNLPHRPWWSTELL